MWCAPTSDYILYQHKKKFFYICRFFFRWYFWFFCLFSVEFSLILKLDCWTQKTALPPVYVLSSSAKLSAIRSSQVCLVNAVPCVSGTVMWNTTDQTDCGSSLWRNLLSLSPGMSSGLVPFNPRIRATRLSCLHGWVPSVKHPEAMSLESWSVGSEGVLNVKRCAEFF